MKIKESEDVELKKSTSELKEAIISITAILNKHKKGTLYFGIKNDGNAIGQHITESTLREISQAIANSIEPKIYPEIKTETIDRKNCVKVSFEGHEQPYFAYGQAYIRVADENRQLSAKELENIILRKTAARWDSKTSDAPIDEADEETLTEFIQKANHSQRIKFKYTNKKDVLRKLNLTKDSRLTNSARLLFSKKGPIEVQTAVFAGIDKTTFLDIKQFKGNIFQLLKISESYIKEHINWKAKLAERTREEIPEIPIRAITETLVNSFCHRDYQVPESNKIAIYKDRIEIWNPGSFPEGYKPQDFISQDLPSILRNPSVANNLYLSADIEKWGSGLKRISKECKANSVKVEFKVLKYGFTVQFTRPKNVPETVPETVPENRLNIIIRHISNNDKVTIPALAKLLKVNEKTIKRDLEKLKANNKLKRVGPDKGGHWEILK
ncbi:MAG: ATP-binding protein [Nanoarchaeota archaeon]|nr:ATP-binding protein [Nanoarchaeota archaeon]